MVAFKQGSDSKLGGIELSSLQKDALFFVVSNGFTGTDTDIDTTTEADWRKFGGLDFNDSDIAIRKGHLVYLHDRLRKDVALAAHGADILLKIVGILEAGARSVIVGADEQVTRLAGVHDVVGKGTDCLAEPFPWRLLRWCALCARFLYPQGVGVWSPRLAYLFQFFCEDSDFRPILLDLFV